LPDGLFSNQKSQFGKILECLRWENIDSFYGHLEYLQTLGYLMTIWYIMCSFGTFSKKNPATLIGSRWFSTVECKPLLH
jgi:hypothetical protein